MATEIDHTANERRIESILKLNTTLFDAGSTDGTQLVAIEEGQPLVNEFVSERVPGAFISLQSETFTQKGTDVSHDVRYLVRIMIAEPDKKTAEVRMNSFQKLILETLEDNIQLESGGSDPKCDFSRPDFITRVKESNETVQSRDIILKCIITTS